MTVSNNLTVKGNIIFTGTQTTINTKNLDIDDPIITVGNNVNISDKENSGILIKGKDNKYLGIIKNTNVNEGNNLYLLNNIVDDKNESINYQNKANLILNNITTSEISNFNGALFKNKIVIPNGSNNDAINVYSDLNIEKSLTVDDKFILLNTNSFHSKGSSLFSGTTLFEGHTILQGHVDYTGISTLSIDHLNVRAFIHSENKLETKSLDIHDELIMPADPNKIREVVGSIYYNSATQMFTGYDGSQWMYLGGIGGAEDTYIYKSA